MDGNFSRAGVTADLEAMQRAGIGGVMLMEVDVGIPRGPVNFMSDEWRAIFKHAVEEAERLATHVAIINKGEIAEHLEINTGYLAAYSAFTGAPAVIIMSRDGKLPESVEKFASLLE